MSKKINFAISGCGNIAGRHASAIVNYGNLVAVCDSDVNKALKLAEHFQCEAYDSLHKMLNEKTEIDMVSICTPNFLHAPQSVECLQNKKQVLCEKPMAITVKDAEEMIAAAKHADKNLFIVKQLRYYPSLIFIKNLLEKGRLGKIYSFHINCFWNRPDAYYKDWKGSKQKDGGALFTQFSHYIDLLIWLFGEVKEVQFLSGNLAHAHIEYEDVGLINMKMETGCIGSMNYTVNAFEKNAENSFSIFAENGQLKLTGQMLEKFEYFNVKNTIQPEFAQENTPAHQSHFKVYEHVVNALNGNASNALKADESISTIRLIERIYHLQHQ
jgi:predicted dehydrogenase